MRAFLRNLSLPFPKHKFYWWPCRNERTFLKPIIVYELWRSCYWKKEEMGRKCWNVYISLLVSQPKECLLYRLKILRMNPRSIDFKTWNFLKEHTFRIESLLSYLLTCLTNKEIENAIFNNITVYISFYKMGKFKVFSFV